jgi:type IV pilus assembly protein PilC
MATQALKKFSYTGINRYKKRVKGNISAVSVFEAKSLLRGKKVTQLIVREVRAEKKSKRKKKHQSWMDLQVTWGPFGDLSTKELLIFTKKLATMVRSGLPILDSLQLIESQTKHVIFKSVLVDIVDTINNGASFSAAIGKHPRYFDNIYRNMVEAGEMTGKLDAFLERIVYGLERMEAIRSGIKSALFYPLTLVVVTLIIVYFMLTNVVPIFVQMYANMGAKLPAATQMIVDASEWIMNGTNLLKVALTVFLVVTVNTWLLKKVSAYRFAVDSMLLKLPLFGNIIVKSTVARMALLMANLFAAGIAINEILRVAATSSSNILFSQAQQRISERLTSGAELSELFEAEDVFPPELAQLIKVGEKTGNMEDMLSSVSRYYQEEFESVIKGLITVIEPLMIVFVGSMIGLLVFALYLPIFGAGDVFSGRGP